MTHKNDFDVVIVGAGPAGSTAAYYLAKGGLRIALLDKTDFPRDKTCGDGLSPRALAVLLHLGLFAKAFLEQGILEQRAFARLHQAVNGFFFDAVAFDAS